MKIVKVNNYEEMSAYAYGLIRDIVINKPHASLGLATGSTPLGLYKLMIQDFNSDGISYKSVSTYNLDEYVGLGKGDSQSYAEFMKANLFNHIDISLSNTHLPDGKAKDIESECAEYNRILACAEIDAQVLGIGANGHIGFNEPGTPFDSETHIITLAQKTIEDNSRFFKAVSEVPTRAISMGIKNILDAKSIILLASGENKAEAVRRTVYGEITTEVPATSLRMHGNVVLILDKEAASKL